MFRLSHRLSLKHLAGCLPPQLWSSWQSSVLNSLQPPTERSPCSHLAFLPYAVWKSIGNRLALAALICSLPLLWLPPFIQPHTILPYVFHWPSCHFSPFISSQLPLGPFLCTNVLHLFFFNLLNSFFCPPLCLCPQFMPTCSHQAFAYWVASSTYGFSVRTSFPRTAWNTYTPPMVSLMARASLLIK